MTNLLRKHSIPHKVTGAPICDGKGLRRVLAKGLHGAVDGCGLKSCSDSPNSYRWVEQPNRLMSGANYIGAIQIRGNLVQTPACMARGHPSRSPLCDACKRVVTLGHILQVCPRTYGSCQYPLRH